MYRYVNLKLCALMTFSSDWGNNIEYSNQLLHIAIRITTVNRNRNNHAYVAGMKLTFQNIIRINSLSVWNFIGIILVLFHKSRQRMAVLMRKFVAFRGH